MHELTIAQSILSIAGSAIPKNNHAVVTAIDIQIGELSVIEIDSLEFAFSVIRANTVFKKAKLNIEIIQGEAICTDCRTVFPLRSFGTCCPDCKGFSMKILKGKELKVLNITIDEE
jgi:hydrogenase nickel incorporation protein HypA/HybF